MKAYCGSIQKKGRRYYLVIRVQGRQKWIALKTADRAVALRRAARVACSPCSELAWLEHLVCVGERARAEIAGIAGAGRVTWGNLADMWLSRPEAPRSPDAAATHRRWLAELADVIAGDCPFPSGLAGDRAAAAARILSDRLVSAPRMVCFFRRAWRLLKLGGAWEGVTAISRRDSEFFRRLSFAEVSMLHSHLSARSAELAAMAEIGYATGLRLSDVANLETTSIAPKRGFLLVRPRKTRRAKKTPLLVPLPPFVRGRVYGLAAAAAARRDRFLFSAEARKRPTRLFQKAFAACGIEKQGGGRAGFHSLRATFISLMDEAGVPPHVTDAITGHAPAGMHGRYTQPSASARMKAVERAIPPLGGMPRPVGPVPPADRAAR